jgi:Protein of unknown function (DUF1549)/Protein of unknown function (DUF1553)
MREPRNLLLLVALLIPSAEAVGGPVHLPNGETLQQIDFERHVLAVLGRSGCNAGSCHGSFQGKGGFRLSLFSHNPALDHAALTRAAAGRRINLLDPDSSLLLLKPTAQVPHEGGRRFGPGSWQAAVLREWIAQGTPWKRGSGAVRHLEVQPAEHLFRRTGEKVRLRVLATFADGSRADVTPFCEFRSRDPVIAEVSDEGVVRAISPGTTALIVSYLGHPHTARVHVPVPVSRDFRYPQIHPNNLVDRQVLAGLRRIKVVPSDLADDATFLRRVSLDVIGALPTPDAVRSFLADVNPLKREKKIDELLAHPLHAALWATRLCDITGANIDVMEGSPPLRHRRARQWHDWFRQRFANNIPYDQIVHGVLCATSRNGQKPREWIRAEVTRYEALQRGERSDYAVQPGLDLFWRRPGIVGGFSLERMAEQTASAFLGVRIDCAQCHRHPFDGWTQRDYRAYANVFARVRFDYSPEVRAAVYSLLEEQRRKGASPRPLPRLREVYVATRAASPLTDLKSRQPLPAKALGGPELSSPGDPREALFHWLTQPRNPYFAQSFVNRVWAHYFGMGLVEPVDNFSAANPPSNPALLDALARFFTRSGYDIRRLERLILTSRTYQLSPVCNATNGTDRTGFSRSYPRRLMAEVVVDTLNDALGVPGEFGPDAPPGARAIEVAANRVRDPHLARVFRLFGRPERTTPCDCERSPEPALPQTLFLMADPTLIRKITEGRLARLLAADRPDSDVIEELFLATLSRFPDDNEKRWAREHLQSKARKAAHVDIVWALINTREFILNH